MDTACALMSCFDLLSSNVSGGSRVSRVYRPVFSYTATAVRDLNVIMKSLTELDSVISNNPRMNDCVKTMECQQSKFCNDLESLKVDLHVRSWDKRSGLYF